MSQILRFGFVVFALALPISGCGTMKVYEGSEREKSQIAVLRTELWESLLPMEQLFVDNIDGLIVAGKGMNKFELLPGTHRIGLTFMGATFLGSYPAPAYIEFEARAGRLYIVKAKVSDARLYTWIVDSDNGKFVAGLRPRGR